MWVVSSSRDQMFSAKNCKLTNAVSLWNGVGGFFLLPFIFRMSGIQSKFMTLHFSYCYNFAILNVELYIFHLYVVCEGIVNMLDYIDLFNTPSVDWLAGPPLPHRLMKL